MLNNFFFHIWLVVQKLRPASKCQKTILHNGSDEKYDEERLEQTDTVVVQMTENNNSTKRSKEEKGQKFI